MSDNLPQSRVVVTGGSGFIGASVVREALRQGYAVTSLIRDCEPRVDLPGLETAVVDWATPLELRSLLAELAPHAIIHCAGSSARGSESTSAIYEANVAIAWRLLEAVGAACPGAGVVLLSSAAVYGPEPATPTAEDAPLDPRTHYAHSKVLAEGVARAFAATDAVRALIARPFNVIGPGEPAGSVVERIARQLIAGDAEPELRLREVRSVRDFVDVDDVASALLRIAERGEAGRAYNICSGSGVTILELIDTGAGIGSQTPKLLLEAEDTPASLSLGDPGRLHALGWTPSLTLEQSMARVFGALRDKEK